MKHKALFVSLLLLLGWFFSGSAFSQGIKGQETRRHTISLTKSRGSSSGNETQVSSREGRQKRSDRGDQAKKTVTWKQILMIGQEPLSGIDTELVAAMDYLRELGQYDLKYSTFEEIRRHPKRLREATLIWFHRPDTTAFSSVESDPKTLSHIRDYLDQGGSILLTMNAFPYIHLLGIETRLPSVRQKASVDEGYGRKLGFHAFREHPLFTGLNGGSYIYRPDHDLTVRVNGFFGDTLPDQGKVVAIDWDYIFFREHSKVIVEYEVGKGKLIAVGAYMLFSVPNGNRLHLEQFTKNCMDYLTGKLDTLKRFYWDYSPPLVTPCPEAMTNRNLLALDIPPAIPWEVPPDPLAFPVHQATSAYCEAAGERILIMGQEKGGLEEVWTHPFMALRDFMPGIRQLKSDSVRWLSQVTPDIEIRTDGFIRQYRLDEGTLGEMVVADPVQPFGVVHYTWDGINPVELSIRFRTNLRLMWPYAASATGSICYGWDQALQAFSFTDKTGEMAVMVGGNRPPVMKDVRPGAGLSAEAYITYLLSPGESIDLVIAAGDSGLQDTQIHLSQALNHPNEVLLRNREHVMDLFGKSLLVTTPDSNFNKGYLWALLGSDRFFVTTPGMGSALVAGYATTRRGWDGGQPVSGRPGYAWYFGRDGEWSGLAFLDIGDAEKVRKNLEFYLKFQDLNGKIFHEATTSGVIHYDAADATPLFLVLAGRYFLKTADTAFIRNNWRGMKKALDFCFSTDTDQDHLIENTNVGHGWVEGGQLFGSHSSFYLNGCWAAALELSGRMAEVVGDSEAVHYKSEARIVKTLVEEIFWDPRHRFYSYGINKDGSQRTDETILPAVPAYFGLTDRFKMWYLLKQYASNAFSTNWGTRIVGEENPLFKPTGYHYGSVWPLFTGWTALAEYRYGNPNQGFSHIMNNLNVYRNWGLGYVEEVLNGAEYEPSGVCPHQCWSETMVIQPVIEGMLGIGVDATKNEITLAPSTPADWDSLSVENIRIGDQLVNYTCKKDSTRLRFDFRQRGDRSVTIKLMTALPSGIQVIQVLLNGNEHPFATFTNPRFISLQSDILLQVTASLEIDFTGGISVLPCLSYPAPGDPAEGMRLLDAYMKGEQYIVALEGLSGSSDTLSIWSYYPLEEPVEGVSVIGQNHHIIDLIVDFQKSDAKYAHETITLVPKKE